MHQQQKRWERKFFNVYSLTIRNTQLDSRPCTFVPELLPNSFWQLYSRWFQCPSPHLGHTHLSRQCWQFPIQLDLILPARHPQRPRHSHAAPPLLWLLLLSRYPTSSVSFSSHMRMAHPPRSGIRSPSIDINLQLAPIRHTNTRAPAFNFKKAHWDEFETFNFNFIYFSLLFSTQ